MKDSSQALVVILLPHSNLKKNSQSIKTIVFTSVSQPVFVANLQ
jgi:hypothetical protein